MTTDFGRVLRTGLSSLRDRAASRLAALRFNPSRVSLDDFERVRDAIIEGASTYRRDIDAVAGSPGLMARAVLAAMQEKAE